MCFAHQDIDPLSAMPHAFAHDLQGPEQEDQVMRERRVQLRDDHLGGLDETGAMGQRRQR